MTNIKFRWYYKESKDAETSVPILNSENVQIETSTPHFIIPKGLIGKYVYCTLIIEGESGYSDISETFESVGEINAVEVTPQIIEGQSISPTLVDSESIKVGTRLTAKTKDYFKLTENPSSIGEPYDSRGEQILPPSIRVAYGWERGKVVEGVFVPFDDGNPISEDAYYDVQPEDVGNFIQLTYTLSLEDDVNYKLTTNTFKIVSGDGVSPVEKGELVISTSPTIVLNGETINDESIVSYGDTLSVVPPITTPSSEDVVYQYQWVKVDKDGNIIPLTEPSSENTTYTIGDTYNVDGEEVTAQSGDQIKCIVSVDGITGYEPKDVDTITTNPTSQVEIRINDFSIESENGIKVGETVSIKSDNDQIVVYEPSNGKETSYDVTYEWGIVEGEGEDTIYRPIANANGENFTITGDLSNKEVYCKIIISNIGDDKNFNIENNTSITTFTVASGVLTGKVTILGTNLIGETLTANVEELVEGSSIKATWYSSEHDLTIDDIETFNILKESDFVKVNGTTDDSLTYQIESNLSGKNIWVVVDVECLGYEHNGSTILKIHDNTDAEHNVTENVEKVVVSPLLEVTEKPNYDKFIINDTFEVTPSLVYSVETPSATTSIKDAKYTWFASESDSDVEDFVDIFENSNTIVSSTNDNRFTVNNADMVNKYLYCRLSDIELNNNLDFNLTPTEVFVKVAFISIAKFTIEDLNIVGEPYYGQKLTATCTIKDARGNVVQQIS